MADYRCYFLGRGGISSFGGPNAFDAAEDIRAETDDAARSTADALYGQRQNRIHGFELWQGTRLVLRRSPSEGTADHEVSGR